MGVGELYKLGKCLVRQMLDIMRQFRGHLTGVSSERADN